MLIQITILPMSRAWGALSDYCQQLPMACCGECNRERRGTDPPSSPTLTIRVVPAEEGGYIASVDELPGAITQGESIPEALANVVDSIAVIQNSGTVNRHSAATGSHGLVAGLGAPVGSNAPLPALPKNALDEIISLLTGSLPDDSRNPIEVASEAVWKMRADIEFWLHRAIDVASAAREFAETVAQIENSDEIRAIYQLAALHGAAYSGPTWERAESLLRVVLDNIGERDGADERTE